MRWGLGVCLLLVACTKHSNSSEVAHPDATPAKAPPVPSVAAKPAAETESDLLVENDTGTEAPAPAQAKVEPSAEDLERARSVLITKPATFTVDMGESEYRTKCGWSYIARMWSEAEHTAGQKVADQLCEAGCTPKLCEKRKGPNDACARTACFLDPDLRSKK